MTNSDLDIRAFKGSDKPHVIALHRRVFGPGRFARSAYRVRESIPQEERSDKTCSRIGWIGPDIAAAVTMTPITIGGTNGAALLGPLVVAPEFSRRGLGEPMVRAALDAAQASGIKLVVLVGDLAYYRRFGFEVVKANAMWLPGPVNVSRLLALELVDGSLGAFHGLIEAQRAGVTC